MLLKGKTMPRLVLALLLLLACCGSPLAAEQSTEPERISLDQAIAIALRDNRALKAAGFGAQAAQDEAGVARGALLPQLDVLENFSYTNNPVMVFSDLLLQQDFSQSDFALNSLNHPGFLSNFQTQTRLSYPLFAGGRLIAAYRAAGFAADAERWQEIQTRQHVQFAVIQAYYCAVLAEQRLGVVDRAIAAAQAHLKRAEDLFQRGMAVNSDVLRTKVMVGGFEQQRFQAESNLKIAWAALAHALGDEDRRLAPVKNPAGAQEILALPPESFQPLVNNALARRPEIKITEDGIKRAREGVKIARADYLPSVEIAGVYENDSERLTRAGNNGALLLAGRMNLFNGFATRAKLDAAKAQLSRAQVLEQDLRQSIALEVETAYRSLANVSVLDAQTTRAQTDMRLAAARIEVAVDAAALDLATGVEPRPAEH
jgi:outer membrane protein